MDVNMKLTFKGTLKREGDVRSFFFEPPAPITWKPGQYMHYTLKHSDTDDRGDKRWFTISSAPSEKDIAISTRISADRKSSFKTALLALKKGDTIETDNPEGDFIIEDPNRNYIFIAGGIGITPYRSMLVDAAVRGQQLNVELLYANRTNEIAFMKELDKLKDVNPNLKIDYIIQPRRIDNKLLEQKIDETDNPMVYVSGPEPMVEAMSAQLSKIGIDQDNIKGDYFPGYEAD
jgi:ferredoxin-NADP reductase